MDGADVAARPLRAHDSATQPRGISLLHDVSGARNESWFLLRKCSGSDLRLGYS